MDKELIRKICLGTAQIATNYGINNFHKNYGYENSNSILRKALELGIRTIDTAPSYINSEESIGNFSDREKFKIITKVAGCTGQDILSSIKHSLKKISVSHLDCVLIHKSSEINLDNIFNIFNTLYQLKHDGLTKRIGVSIYAPEELDIFLRHVEIDVVQAPFNILDKRIISSGYANELFNNGIEIHARSIFLQGLLLLPLDEIKKRNFYIDKSLLDFFKYVEETKLNQYDICLNYALHQKLISKIILGIDSTEQLNSIERSKNQIVYGDHIRNGSIKLIDPRMWI